MWSLLILSQLRERGLLESILLLANEAIVSSTMFHLAERR